jgi:hypothetical protein
MINGYDFLSEMDDLLLYNSSESSRSIGLDRKTFSLRGKRLGLGQERELTEEQLTTLFITVYPLAAYLYLWFKSAKIIR